MLILNKKSLYLSLLGYSNEPSFYNILKILKFNILKILKFNILKLRIENK